MTTDHFVSKGLTQRKIAELAAAYRTYLGVPQETNLDIIDILEFRLPKQDPDFELVILKDSDIDCRAYTSTIEKKIVLSESVYEAACEGDPEARFDIAHEIGHYIMHFGTAATLNKNYSIDKYEPKFPGMNSTESAESQADIFARHFLVSIKTAYTYKDRVDELIEQHGIPKKHAKSMITVSKRQEMYDLR